MPHCWLGAFTQAARHCDWCAGGVAKGQHGTFSILRTPSRAWHGSFTGAAYLISHEVSCRAKSHSFEIRRQNHILSAPLTQSQDNFAMDRTPPEILFSILEYVATTPDHAISQYAAVTRDWQVAVEHITFRSLRLSASDLDAFQEAFQGEKVGRRGYLRALEVQPTFTENRQPDECCEATRVLDREADGKVWSSLVTRLFIILDDITQRSKTRTSTLPPVALTFLSAFRGARKDYPPLVGFSTRCTSGEHEPEEIEAARAPPGTIEFYGAQTLPSLPHIATIIWHGWGESKFLRPTWIGQVAKKLPDLRDLVLQLEDAYDWGCTWRRHYQSGMHPCSFHVIAWPDSSCRSSRILRHAAGLDVGNIPLGGSLPGATQ